ncbi:hypothetical protein H6G04_10215 [Calothrix membranacea FACHB-236]|nr:hypothetical protein [Calothrix membranacea FACHB-236]
MGVSPSSTSSTSSPTLREALRVQQLLQVGKPAQRNASPLRVYISQ